MRFNLLHQASVWNSKFLKNYLLEVLLAMVHCPPGVDYVIKNTQLSK